MGTDSLMMMEHFEFSKLFTLEICIHLIKITLPPSIHILPFIYLIFFMQYILSMFSAPPSPPPFVLVPKKSILSCFLVVEHVLIIWLFISSAIGIFINDFGVIPDSII